MEQLGSGTEFSRFAYDRTALSYDTTITVAAKRLHYWSIGIIQAVGVRIPVHLYEYVRESAS